MLIVHFLYLIGFGFPGEHIDYAYSNGCDALALTDHGNMNGLSYQVLHVQKMRESGKEFKPIFGVEAYFHPSIAQWKIDKEQIKADKEANKKANKEVLEEEVELTVEDESASKSAIKSVLNKRRHMILLAMNQKGLSNIFKMVSLSYQGDNYYRFPRIDYEILKQYNEGVIAASACLGGVYAGDYWENLEKGKEAILDAMRETTRKMMAIFGDRWYGELQWNSASQQHDVNQFIIQLSKEFGFKLISTADSHYPRPELWMDRILYKKIGWLNKSDEEKVLPKTVDEVGYELYPKNGDQMFDSYKKYSEQVGVSYDDELVKQSIEETHDIAFNRIENFLPDTKVKLPNFVIPAGMTADEALTKMAKDALKKRKFPNKKDYEQQLEKELSVICGNKFAQYFLTMKAIIDKANDVMLIGPGRGSAAGSLVSYLLGITQIDPLKWELQFERFMRKGQKDYPDIDTDFSSPMELKELLIKDWGNDKVVPISNWNTLQLKSLIKDIAKFYDIPFTEVNAVTSKMLFEATPLAKAKHGIKAGVYTPTFEEVMEFSESLRNFLEKYPHVEKHVNSLHGMIRSNSRHAGGVVITENVDSAMPLINSGGTIQTPWAEGQNVRHLEPFGFIKFDILGLETLKMIETCIYHILKRHQNIKNPTFKQIQNYYNTVLHPDVLDMDDLKVYENVFHNQKWAGVFQFANQGAQSFCARAKPRNIIDLSAITSIYRPGPLNADVDKNYVAAQENVTSIKYIHPVARDVVASTYGFLVFQEQIAAMAHKLGKDISLEEGNQLRKVLTKKGTGKEDKVKTALFSKFIDGCIEKGISKQQAEKQWEMFEFFSGYGFNKSHAVSYSIISYQCAWLLTYFMPEWIAAFLDKSTEKEKEQAINIAKSFGFEIQNVDVNTSGNVWEISPDGKTLIQPLTSIKGFGEAAFNEIIRNRPFKTIDEFLFHDKISYSKLNKKALDVLCRAGALQSLQDPRFTGAKHFWSAVAVQRVKTQKKFNENIEKFAPEGNFTENEQIENITSLTGCFPLNKVMTPRMMEKLEESGIKPISEYEPELMFSWFIPRTSEIKKTKSGKDYLVLTVLDGANTVTKIKCWGYNPAKDNIQMNKVYIARLDYEEQYGFSTRSIKKNFRLLA